MEQGPDNQQTRQRKRGIYLLPSLFTTAGLFAGFFAIVAAMGGRYSAAALAVFIAMVMDGIDGRVARLTNTQTDFGAHYDSLSDMVCFGLAPALVMYAWSLHHAVVLGWAKLGWLAAFIFTAGAALRLARFNAEMATGDKRWFKGLPSPSAAAVVTGLVWVGSDTGIAGADAVVPAMILTIGAGLLMVSNVRYYSFKEIDFRNRVPFVAGILVVLGFVLMSIDPPKILFGGFLAYVLSGPLLTVWALRRRRFRRGGGG